MTSLTGRLPQEFRAETLDIRRQLKAAEGRLDGAEGRLTPLETATAVTAWTGVSLTSPWRTYQGTGSGYQIPQYRKIGDIVYLRGLVDSNGVAIGAGGFTTTICTLPVGFRPPSDEIFASWGFTTGQSDRGIRVDVLDTGVVRMEGYGLSGTISYLSLSGIQFSVTS